MAGMPPSMRRSRELTPLRGAARQLREARRIIENNKVGDHEGHGERLAKVNAELQRIIVAMEGEAV